jgi:hypothetical protein
MASQRSPVTEEEQALLDLNRRTFAAEEQAEESWAAVLHATLADDFRLRRGIGEIEDRERMIARLSRTEPAEREIVGEPQVAVLEDTGTVRSRVRMGTNVFRNVKLFEKTPAGWRCVYWRVTREEQS